MTNRTLGDVVEVAHNLPHADCYLRARGTTVTLGLPRRLRVPGDLGLRARDPSTLSPDALWALLLTLYGRGAFTRIARGDDRLLTLDPEDVARLPVPCRGRRGVLALAMVAGLILAGPATAAEPVPDLVALMPGGTFDPVWSEARYAVAPDAVRPRPRYPDESPEESALLDRAAADGIHTYLRRVSAMVAGMNLPDGPERDAACREMAGLLASRFQHTEGRRNRSPDGGGGFAVRTKPQLERACAARAFRLTGFMASTIRAQAITPDLAQVVTCYSHDQIGDPLVTGTGRLLPNGRRAVPRVSVETVAKGPDGAWTIALHVALDSDEALTLGGCAAP